MQTFKALKNRAVLMLFAGQVLSAMGDQVYFVAANWVATREWGSNGALVSMTFFLANLIFCLPGGVYADRINQRTAMIAIDLMRALAVLTLPIVYFCGDRHVHLVYLVIVSFVIGGLGSLFETCLIKGTDAIGQGDEGMVGALTTLMTTPLRIARTVAPTMIGPLNMMLPIIHFFTLDAISFAVSALSIVLLDPKYAWEGHADNSRDFRPRSFLVELREGVEIVRQHTLLRWSVITQAIGNVFFATAFFIGVPMLVQQKFGDHIDLYGLIIGVYGVSGVLTTLFIDYIPRARYGQFIFVGEVLFGIGFTMVGLAKSIPVTLLGAFIAAPGGPLGDISLRVINSDVPKDQRGKVIALNSMRLCGPFAVGLLLAQCLLAYLPASVVVTSNSLVILLIGLIGLVKFSVGTESACNSPIG